MDALFIVGLKNMAELSALPAETTLPLKNIANAPGELESSDLSPHKVRICLQGHLPLMAAVQSVYETMKALRDGTNPAQIKNSAPTTLMKVLTRAAYYDEATRNYLSV